MHWNNVKEYDANRYDAERVKKMKRCDLIPKLILKMQEWMGFSNSTIKGLQWKYRKGLLLKKKYKRFLSAIDLEREPYNGERNPNVWVCWFQGMENAPEIVRICYESVHYYLKDAEIHLITSENFDQYIDLPAYIIKKWKEGMISHTHFSDIVRTALLVKHGGLWLDATVYLTGSMPSYVYRKPLFLLHTKLKEDVTIEKTNWLIYAQRNNRTLRIVQLLLYDYWKTEKDQSLYFLWQVFAKMALHEYPDDLDDIYYVSEEMAHDLSYCLYKQYDPEYWNLLLTWTPFHKLSYYIFNTQDRKKPEVTEGTYYDYISRKRRERMTSFSSQGHFE